MAFPVIALHYSESAGQQVCKTSHQLCPGLHVGPPNFNSYSKNAVNNYDEITLYYSDVIKLVWVQVQWPYSIHAFVI